MVKVRTKFQKNLKKYNRIFEKKQAHLK